MNENKELVPVNNELATPSFADELQERNITFCSMQANTPREKAALFKAMNNPEKRIADCINMTIKVKDIFCETVQCVQEGTEEVEFVPRIVLIDDKGIGYQAVSLGVFSALKKLIQVFGTPTWNEPIPVKVRQISKGNRQLLTFDVDF